MTSQEQETAACDIACINGGSSTFRITGESRQRGAVGKAEPFDVTWKRMDGDFNRDRFIAAFSLYHEKQDVFVKTFERLDEPNSGR